MKYFNQTLVLLAFLILATGCGESPKGVFSVAFLDSFEDETVGQAKKGFFKALNDSGYTSGLNIKVTYRNAQGDIPALSQAVDFFVTQEFDLIAANTTLSTIAAVKKNKTLPVCMMVSPSPELAGLRSKEGKDPANLFGVFETLEYIDTALALIPAYFPKARKVGVIINQSEPQSRDALSRLQNAAAPKGLEVVALPANNSSETQLVIESLISKGIDVFFALPDNTIFASFETIAAACDKASIPVITSESGLVKRGAVMAFGADMYQWGYEAGQEAVKYFRTGKIPAPVKLHQRQRLINREKAALYGIQADSTFSVIP
jgi:putative tryptophan/tyrosine transport system substrate-binding protein